MSEINVIPFTDVILVILVIFIMAAPVFMQSSIKVHLPETTRNPLTAQNTSIRVVISKKNDVYINETYKTVGHYQELLTQQEIDDPNVKELDYDAQEEKSSLDLDDYEGDEGYDDIDYSAETLDKNMED